MLRYGAPFQVVAPSRFRPIGYRAGGPNPQPGPNPAAGPGVQPGPAPQPTPNPQPGPAPPATTPGSSSSSDPGLFGTIGALLTKLESGSQVALGALIMGVGILLALGTGAGVAQGARRAVAGGARAGARLLPL